METVNILGSFSNNMFQCLYIHYGRKFSGLYYGRNYICHYKLTDRGFCTLLLFVLMARKSHDLWIDCWMKPRSILIFRGFFKLGSYEN